MQRSSSVSTVNTNQPSINPHLKFTPAQKSVVNPPNVYQYSLQEELQLGENQYKQILKSLNKSRLAIIAEKHPNLKSNIISVFKYSLAIAMTWATIRYRHSIPFIKSFCKAPKKTPPSFSRDLDKIWQSIVKK